MTTTARHPAGVPLLPGEDPNVVYPEEEKVPESELQGNARRYVQSALSIRYQDQPGVYVAGDLFVFYRMNDAEARLAPDIMVVFGAAESPPPAVLAGVEGRGTDARLCAGNRFGGGPLRMTRDGSGTAMPPWR